jgi:hypothetical protein
LEEVKNPVTGEVTGGVAEVVDEDEAEVVDEGIR